MREFQANVPSPSVLSHSVMDLIYLAFFFVNSNDFVRTLLDSNSLFAEQSWGNFLLQVQPHSFQAGTLFTIEKILYFSAFSWCTQKLLRYHFQLMCLAQKGSGLNAGLCIPVSCCHRYLMFHTFPKLSIKTSVFLLKELISPLWRSYLFFFGHKEHVRD